MEMNAEKHILPKGLLEVIIANLIEERVFTGTKYIENDKIEKELISLSNTIRDKIGSEQNLFMRYEELSTVIENSLLRDIYRKGFFDGLALLREMLLGHNGA